MVKLTHRDIKSHQIIVSISMVLTNFQAWLVAILNIVTRHQAVECPDLYCAFIWCKAVVGYLPFALAGSNHRCLSKITRVRNWLPQDLAELFEVRESKTGIINRVINKRCYCDKRWY